MGPSGSGLAPRIGDLAAHLGRIDYRSRLADGRSIGSGLIEGQVKTLGLRRKARGARWVERNPERMAALVGLSHRTFWDTYWSLAAGGLRKPVAHPEFRTRLNCS